jgi:hypothetical protein
MTDYAAEGSRISASSTGLGALFRFGARTIKSRGKKKNTPIAEIVKRFA